MAFYVACDFIVALALSHWLMYLLQVYVTHYNLCAKIDNTRTKIVCFPTTSEKALHYSAWR